MVKLRLSTWNVITVDNEERRDEIYKEINKHNIDIACLQETKKLNHEYTDMGYTFFSPVKDKGKSPHGVGFASKNGMLERFYSYFDFDPNRLIVVKLIFNTETIHINNVYAPTDSKGTNTEGKKRKSEDKDSFYGCLEEAFSTIPENETVFIIGDFNAQVGADNVAWPTCFGPYGVGQINDNGQRLLEFCSLHNLCVLNTFTELPESEQFTRRHPRWKKWSQLDLCITRVSDRHKVITTRPVANLCPSFDHKMVILDIDTERNMDSNMQNDKFKTLFRYVLRSVHILIKTEISLPVEVWPETLFPEDFSQNISEFSKILEAFNINYKIFFYDQDQIPTDEVITKITSTIIQMSELFLKEKLMIKDKNMEMFLEVKSYLADCRKVDPCGTAEIKKYSLSKKDEREIKSVILKYLEKKTIEIH